MLKPIFIEVIIDNRGTFLQVRDVSVLYFKKNANNSNQKCIFGDLKR